MSATVAKKNKDVDESIEKFLSTNKNFVIGLNIELSFSRDSEVLTRSKIAILSLCDGQHCLIVQLPHLDSVPTSLCNFLQLTDYTFVGFDIARSMERLEKEYGFGCKNYDDLKTMAAKYDNQQGYAAFWGSASMVDNLRYEKFRTGVFSSWNPFEGNRDKLKNAVFYNWGDRYLNENQVTRATINVYVNHRLGEALGYF
uniref:uncharacterized protein LOC105350755 n=1 Tax=Fragaria vesca subsp. vesca TaxID=101020 RepID=UPI0005CB591E|nr:PREDICTED: uncharacterized protein LOC105350755 [Fragaria vesca subsp. vesca]